MNKLQRAAIVTELVSKLSERGSWCGETHIQKSLYFLQELTSVPISFDFILYKHGPYSFDAKDVLTDLRADGLLSLEPRPYPYGPSYAVSENFERYRKLFPKTLSKFQKDIVFVARALGDKGVMELEQLSSALFATKMLGKGASARDRADQIRKWKPHIGLNEALSAVEMVDRITSEYRDRHKH